MKQPSVFALMSEVIKCAKASAMMIGGFALNAYKVSRQTHDVDFLIPEKDYEVVRDLLVQEGYMQDYVTDNFARFRSAKKGFMDLDIMFVNDATFEKMKRECGHLTIEENVFNVPSLNHLIALKLHAIKYNPKRENKDLLDIISLILQNDIDVSNNELKAIFLKYGTKELYKRVSEACRKDI